MTDTLILTAEISFSEEPALDEAIDNLITAHMTRLKADTKIAAHKAMPRPRIKSAYASRRQYLEDARLEEEWYAQLDALSSLCDSLWRKEQEAIGEVADYLPCDVWFKHGNSAIAITMLDEESAPQVVVDEWNDEWMPDLRNDETRIAYLDVYPQIVG